MTEKQMLVDAGALLGLPANDSWIWTEAATQKFADNPTAPGGREWEAMCTRKRIEQLERIVMLNQAELEGERARLKLLEGE